MLIRMSGFQVHSFNIFPHHKAIIHARQAPGSSSLPGGEGWGVVSLITFACAARTYCLIVRVAMQTLGNLYQRKALAASTAHCD